jgi:hypothetical protein
LNPSCDTGTFAFRMSLKRPMTVVFATVALGSALVPAVASAGVLVNAIEPSTIACGASIKTGVWYQSFSGGPRHATIQVINAAGHTVWQKSVIATTTWQYFRYKPACHARYTVVYHANGSTSRFPVHVR